MMFKITGIVAVGKRWQIGYKDKLPWGRHKNDLNLFKEVTMGKTLLMGRKTFETLPKKLQGRNIVVLTKNKSYEAPEGVKVFHSVRKVIMHYKKIDGELFIAGGAKVYHAFRKHIHTWLVSFIDYGEIGESRIKDHTLFPKEILDNYHEAMFSKYEDFERIVYNRIKVKKIKGKKSR